MMYSHSIETTLGRLNLYATDKGLAAVTYRDDIGMSDAQPSAAKLKPYADAIIAYLAGRGNDLAALPLDIQWGTELQRKVWKAIHRIPYGQTISYSDLALRVGAPNAVRAAGSACGKNPIPLVIPCHRVLAKDGGLGGFTWGLGVKKKLLALESVALKKAA